MSRYLPEHPKKGSAEAYEWAERMRQARQKKARTKARIREAGQLTEMQFFGPGGSLEVKPKKMRNNLYRICAWCKKDMGKAKPYSDKRPTHGICQACLAKEMKAFPKNNPGVAYHEDAARVAGRYRRDAASNTERTMYAGMEIAHKDSAKAAQAMGINPRRPQPRKAFHLYDTLTRKAVETGKTANEMFDVISSQRLNRKRFVVVDEFYARVKKRRPEPCIANPIAVYNPPAPKVVGTIYNKAIEIRAKKTGSDLAGRYKHVFGNNVKILGLDNGDVVIHHTGGKRLWISREDYERSGGKHE